jgi:ABC-type spermidine/putrescine transport system permease subunit I
MSRPIPREALARTGQLAPAPELAPNVRQALETRHFDLPVALHAGFFGTLLVYLGIMFVGLRSPGLIIPIAICVIFTLGFYAVPALWSGMKPDHADGPMTLAALLERGIQTHTGWCRGRDAVAQVMILPVLILGWGIAVVSIAALV